MFRTHAHARVYIHIDRSLYNIIGGPTNTTAAQCCLLACMYGWMDGRHIACCEVGYTMCTECVCVCVCVVLAQYEQVLVGGVTNKSNACRHTYTLAYTWVCALAFVVELCACLCCKCVFACPFFLFIFCRRFRYFYCIRCHTHLEGSEHFIHTQRCMHHNNIYRLGCTGHWEILQSAYCSFLIVKIKIFNKKLKVSSIAFLVHHSLFAKQFEPFECTFYSHFSIDYHWIGLILSRLRHDCRNINDSTASARRPQSIIKTGIHFRIILSSERVHSDVIIYYRGIGIERLRLNSKICECIFRNTEFVADILYT